jgi:hypothetical protein
MPDVTLHSISIEPMSNGKYLTIIRFINERGKRDETNRIDLHLQGVEEFIRDFRIKHNL